MGLALDGKVTRVLRRVCREQEAKTGPLSGGKRMEDQRRQKEEEEAWGGRRGRGEERGNEAAERAEGIQEDGFQDGNWDEEKS